MRVRPKTPGELTQQILDTHPVNYGGDEERAKEYARFFSWLNVVLVHAIDKAQGLKLIEEAPAKHPELLEPIGPVIGYPAAIRRARHIEQVQFESTLINIGDGYLSQETINLNEQALRTNTIDLTQGPGQALIDRHFPSGSFLLHSTETTPIAGILSSGQIKTTAHFAEDNPNTVHKRTKGGSLGVSWNYNGVDSLTGDRKHLAGFMVDPLKLLQAQGGILAVPQKSCVNELHYYQASPEDIYELRDAELLYNVFNHNIMLAYEMLIFASHKTDSDGKYPEHHHKLAKDFYADMNQLLIRQPPAEEIRKYFRTDANGNLWFASHLHDSNIANVPFLCLLQYAADGYAGEELARQWDYRLPKVLNLKELRTLEPAIVQLSKHVTATMDKYAKQIGINSHVDISDALLYCPKKDYEKWVKAIAKCQHQPAGIVVYDGKNVRTPSAFTHSLPDHSRDELYRQLKRLIGPDALPWEDFFIEKPQTAKAAHYLINATQSATAGVMVLSGNSLKIIPLEEID